MLNAVALAGREAPHPQVPQLVTVPGSRVHEGRLDPFRPTVAATVPLRDGAAL